MRETRRPRPQIRRHAAWLWGLTGVFAFRVAAQPAVLVLDTPLLPRVEAWQGGALPYPALLAAQLLILVWMARTARAVQTRAIVERPVRGRAIGVAGSLYAALMCARLLLGAGPLAGVRWFGSPLPAFFHLGLAAYLLVYAHVHVRAGRAGRAVTAGDGSEASA
jgi:hypothetical protein